MSVIIFWHLKNGSCGMSFCWRAKSGWSIIMHAVCHSVYFDTTTGSRWSKAFSKPSPGPINMYIPYIMNSDLSLLQGITYMPIFNTIYRFNPSENRYLTVVEGFAPWLWELVGSNSPSQGHPGDGSDQGKFRTLIGQQLQKHAASPRLRRWGDPLRARWGRGAFHANTWWPDLHSWGRDRLKAWHGMGPLPCGPITYTVVHKSWMYCQ